MLNARAERGFSLIETLIAAGILVTALSTLAQLVGWSVNQTRIAGRRSRALLIAQDKLERLRAASWSFDLDGLPVSGPELTVSPASSIDLNTPGYVEGIDAFGRIVAPSDSQIVRRWAIDSLGSSSPDMLAITVCAFPAPAVNVPRAGADACVSTARVRQP